MKKKEKAMNNRAWCKHYRSIASNADDSRDIYPQSYILLNAWFSIGETTRKL